MVGDAIEALANALEEHLEALNAISEQNPALFQAIPQMPNRQGKTGDTASTGKTFATVGVEAGIPVPLPTGTCVKASHEQSSFAQALGAAFKIGRVLVGQDPALALQRKLRFKPERLSPGRSAVIRAAEITQTRCQ